MYAVELKDKQTSYLPIASANNRTTNNTLSNIGYTSTTNSKIPTSASQDCITVIPSTVINNTTIMKILLSDNPITMITLQSPRSQKNFKRDQMNIRRLNKSSSVVSNKQKKTRV